MTYTGLSDPERSLSMSAPPGVWEACGVVLGYMIHDCYYLWRYDFRHGYATRGPKTTAILL